MGSDLGTRLGLRRRLHPGAPLTDAAALGGLLLLALIVLRLLDTAGALHIPPSAAAPLLGHAGLYLPERPVAPDRWHRWSAPQAALSLPISGGAQELTLTLARMQGPVTPVELAVAGRAVTLPVGPEQRRYRLLLPPTPALATRALVGLRTPALDAPPGERRPLGVLLGDITLRRFGPLDVWLAPAVVAGLSAAYLALRWQRVRAAPALAVLLIGLALLWATARQTFGHLAFAALTGGVFLAGCALIPLLGQVLARRFGGGACDRREAVALLCAVALGLRLALVPLLDPVGDHTTFALWGVWIQRAGLAGFYNGTIDYPPLWPAGSWLLYWLARWLGSVPFLAVPVPLPLTNALLGKLPAIGADLALTLLIYRTALRHLDTGRAWWLALCWSMLPPLWINSAWWGQVDALPALLLVLALLLWERAGGRWSWALYALALLLKAQMVVFLPLLVVATLRERGLRGLLLGGLAALAAALPVCGPLLLVGQGGRMLAVFTASVGRYPLVSVNAYNLWYLLDSASVGEHYRGLPGLPDDQLWQAGLTYHQAGMLLLGMLCGWVCLRLLWRSDADTRWWAALTLALGFFLLPTQIHERYLFPVFPILGLVWARGGPVRLPLALLALGGMLNLLRAVPLEPSLFKLLAPPEVALLVSALNVGVLAWAICQSPPPAPRLRTGEVLAVEPSWPHR